MVNYGSASKFYDLFGSKNDIAFYRGLAIRHGRKALELGVGTGRVAIELAKAGVSVWGIDNSKYMLAVARQKLRRENPSVRRRIKLKLGDMRYSKLKGTFPFIYIASSTFEHCVTEEDQQKCLKNTYEALRKGGTLAFDISQSSRETESSWYIERKQLDKEREVVRTIFSRLNPQTDTVAVNLFFDVYRNGVLKERYYEYGEAKLSTKESIERILTGLGFKMQEIYGDFDKSPYGEHSKKIVFTCSKS
jgi:ubiquinone/menaquinone biosynthesis C-methylase UbiE